MMFNKNLTENISNLAKALNISTDCFEVDKSKPMLPLTLTLQFSSILKQKPNTEISNLSNSLTYEYEIRINLINYTLNELVEKIKNDINVILKDLNKKLVDSNLTYQFTAFAVNYKNPKNSVEIKY